MLRLSLLFLAFWAQIGAADTVIKLPMQEFPVGTILLYELQNGDIQSRRVTVNDGTRLEIAISSKSPQRTLWRTLVLDADGQTQKVLYPSGREMRFDPHNCYRVVGICSYEITDAAQQTFKRVHRSRFADGVMTIEITDNLGAVLETQEITFDDKGMALRFQRQRGDQQPRSMELIRALRPNGSDYVKDGPLKP